MKQYNGLLKSEIKKIEKYARKVTGNEGCVVTGYSARTVNFCDCEFVQVDAQICDGYGGDYVTTIYFTIFMPDRRRSYVNSYQPNIDTLNYCTNDVQEVTKIIEG